MIRAIAALGTIFVTFVLVAEAQVTRAVYGKLPSPIVETSTREREVTVSQRGAYQSPKRPGHYSAQDWRALVDSLWGPGPPTATKLQVFDAFWNAIDRGWAGFPNLAVNWDSLKAMYRPEIEAGVSRGRFWGIMGHMYLSLQEIHTWIGDVDLDAQFSEGGKLVYRPGIPVFFPSGWGWAGSFGAALTPQPDSSLLVYRALPAHPLGIEPGDVVLGYDRIPWKQLYKELLAAELPLEWWLETRFGSSPRSISHSLLGSAGSNWGLFDTVDIVKYTTGDTLHFSTAPLAGLDYLSLFATEQIPIPGVKLPDYRNGEQVSWGMADGTSIGYVYVYSWDAAVGPAFEAAMRDLTTVKKVTGLILDFRYNRGSLNSWTAANAGLDYLFNENPAGPTCWQTATRNDPANHFGFNYSSPPGSFSPRPDIFDRPIAVLTGPQTWSVGDHTAFRMRFHPMARIFGLPTNGAFINGGVDIGPVFGNWYYSYATGQMRSLVNNEGLLMHKSFPVDEEVWLTREGAAKGEDDVVKRAMLWMGELTYAHDVDADQHYARPGLDSVCVTAVLANPLVHTAVVSAIVTDALGSVRDSLLLMNDGLHGDGSAGDSVWGCRIPAPSDEGVFGVSLRTEDITASSFRRLPNATYFVTAGPLAIDRVDSAQQSAYSYFGFKPYIRNLSTSTSLTGGSVALSCDSPWVKLIVPPMLQLAPLSPNTSASAGVFKMNYDSSAHPDSFTVRFDILVNGTVCWSEWKRFNFSDVEEASPLPMVFSLEQNYPNPFNPSTLIRYTIAGSRENGVGSKGVRLVVYDLLGREVATLVNEKKVPGNYQAKFDASGLASGVYFYKLTAGSFVQTRKMMLVR